MTSANDVPTRPSRMGVDHMPVIVKTYTDGCWAVVCHGCSKREQDYVDRCTVHDFPDWPSLVYEREKGSQS